MSHEESNGLAMMKNTTPIGAAEPDAAATLADVVREIRALRRAMAGNSALLLTAGEAAAYIGVGRTRFFELVQLVPLPPVKLPGQGKMWRRSDLDDFVAAL